MKKVDNNRIVKTIVPAKEKETGNKGMKLVDRADSMQAKPIQLEMPLQQLPKEQNVSPQNNKNINQYDQPAYARYSAAVREIGDIDSMLNAKDMVLSQEVREEKKQRKLYLLNELEVLGPIARKEYEGLNLARAGETNIQRSGVAGAMVGEIAAQAPLYSTVAKMPLASAPVYGAALGVLGETGAEIGQGVGEDIASMATGYKKGDAMRELAMLKNYPDRQAFELIINTPKELQTNYENGMTARDMLKTLPDEYKIFLMGHYPAGSGERYRAWYELYGNDTDENMLKMIHADNNTLDKFMQRSLISGAIETAGTAVGKSLGLLTSSSLVERGFIEGEKTVSKEAIEAAEAAGLKIPYAEKYLPTNKGKRLVNIATSPETSLGRLYRENAKTAQNAFKGTREDLLSIVDNIYKQKGIAAGVNAARTVARETSEDILDTTILQLTMAKDGFSNIDIPKVINNIKQAGKQVATISKKEIIETVKKEAGDMITMPRGDRVVAMQRILRQARDKYRETSDVLFSNIEKYGEGVTAFTGRDEISGIVDKFFGKTLIGTKSKGATLSAVEKELASEADTARYAIQPLLDSEEVGFNELLKFRQDLDNVFPMNNRVQIAALTQIRNEINKNLVVAAHMNGFKKEFKNAMKYYAKYRSNVDSSIYRKILSDEGLMEAYAPALMKGEGYYSIIRDMASKLGPRKKEWFDSLMRETAIDSMLGGSTPDKIYAKMGREIKKLSKPEYDKIKDIYVKYGDIIAKQEASQARVEEAINAMSKEINSITSLSKASRNRINSIMIKMKDSEIGVGYDPARIQVEVARELEKFNTGDSVLNGIVSRTQLEALRDFSEGATAATGRVMTGVGQESLRHATRAGDFYIMKGQPIKAMPILGYIAYMTGRYKTIARKLIDPNERSYIQSIIEAAEDARTVTGKVASVTKEATKQTIKRQAQNTRRAIIRYVREAYEEDGEKIPFEDIIMINDTINHIHDQQRQKTVKTETMTKRN